MKQSIITSILGCTWRPMILKWRLQICRNWFLIPGSTATWSHKMVSLCLKTLVHVSILSQRTQLSQVVLSWHLFSQNMMRCNFHKLLLQIYTYIHTYIYTYIHTYIHTYVCIYVHTHTCTHARMHIYVFSKTVTSPYCGNIFFRHNHFLCNLKSKILI